MDIHRLVAQETPDITNPDGTKSPIKQEEVTESKKILGIYDSPMGGNDGYLSYIVN